jgi:hypothetical protein
MTNIMWLGAALLLVAAIGIVVGLLTSRSTSDLGAVSARWIADHRVDAS